MDAYAGMDLPDFLVAGSTHEAGVRSTVLPVRAPLALGAMDPRVVARAVLAVTLLASTRERVVRVGCSSTHATVFDRTECRLWSDVLALAARAAPNAGARFGVFGAADPADDQVFEWTWYVDAEGGSLRAPARWSVAGRLFAERLAVVASAAQAGDFRLATFDTRSEYERERIHRWSTGDVSPYHGPGLLARVIEQATRREDAVAVVAASERVTYGDLVRRSRAIAEALHGRGVRPGETVAVAVDRSADLVASLLGVWLARAVYVPLDLRYPRSRVEYMLSDCGARLVLRDGAGAASFPSLSASSLDLSAIPSASDAAGSIPDGEDVAYVIYTSGSTGKPKGVRVGHASLDNTIRVKCGYLELAPLDVMASVMSCAFDANLFELLMPLSSGARLVIATQAQLTRSNLLAELLETEAVSVMGATPATWRGLIASGWKGGMRMLVGGEELAADLADELYDRGPLWHMYGLTETAISCLAYRVERPIGLRVPIGRPFANSCVRILDVEGRQASVGVRGELFVGGLGVAKDYLGRPELTAERFVADPLSAEPGFFFRTGDLASFTPDGQVEFAGRDDHQVKIRGVRVELYEVESAFMALPTIHDVCVLAVGSADDAELVAFLVGTVDEPALREALARELPPPMIPSRIVMLPEIPVTANGKADRAALLRMCDAYAMAPAPVAPMREDLASVVHDEVSVIVAESAPAVTLGPDTDFVELGFDSVHLVRLRQRLRTRGIDVSLGDLLASRSPRALTETLSTKAGPERARGVDLVASERVRTHRPMNNQVFPALVSLCNPGTGVWNGQVAFRIRHGFDLGRLIEAWSRVLTRHGTMRTAMRWRGRDELVCDVAPALSEAPARPDLVRLRTSPRHHADELSSLQRDLVATDFDIERAPLSKLTVVTADGRDEADVIWTYHSSLFDGWSTGIVMRELVRVLDALSLGGDPVLAPPSDFRDHVARSEATSWTESAAFFEEYLRGYRLPDAQVGARDRLASAHDVSPEVSRLLERYATAPYVYRGLGVQSAELDVALVSRVRQLAQRLRVLPAVVLQCAWATVLMRRYDTDDIVVGMVGANRVDYEAAVGKYTNMLPLRVRLGQGDRASWLRAEHANLAALMRHEGAPPRAWAPPMNLARGRFPFDATFTCVNYGMHHPLGIESELRIDSVRQLDRSAPPAFGLVVIPGARMLARVEHNAACDYPPDEIEALLSTFVGALAQLVADPAASARSLLTCPTLPRGIGVPLLLLGPSA